MILAVKNEVASYFLLVYAIFELKLEYTRYSL